MEFGAGTGRLAAGLVSALETLGAPLDRYFIVDLSGELRERQRETIATLGGALASRVCWLDALPAQFDGVVIGNEVLDAMPVQLYARTGGVWRARGVTARANGALHYEARALDAAGVNISKEDAALLAELDTHIDPQLDYVAETHSAGAAFTRTVCSMLARGAAFLIDYGFPRAEYYHPQRTEGTLMCHYRHRAHSDPFFYPGLQDLTAHVEFTRIAEAGVETGADLLGYISQARFLMNAGMTEVLAEIDPADTARFLPAANAVQKLMSEAEMGELFKVIAFSRGIDGTLDAFARGDRSHTL